MPFSRPFETNLTDWLANLHDDTGTPYDDSGDFFRLASSCMDGAKRLKESAATPEEQLAAFQVNALGRILDAISQVLGNQEPNG